MALWLCRAGRHGEHEAKFLKEDRIYLTWDGLNEKLTGLADINAVYSMLGRVYPRFSHGHRVQNSGQIWSFVRRMSRGDWVAVPSKRRTIHLAEITGDYCHASEGPNPYCHYRSVKWLQRDIPRTNFARDILNSLGACTTVCQIKRNDAEARVRAMQKNNWKSISVQPPLAGDDAEDGQRRSEMASTNRRSRRKRRRNDRIVIGDLRQLQLGVKRKRNKREVQVDPCRAEGNCRPSEPSHSVIAA
jgi:restriction system protein